jgi:DNA-binding CsgD family transcriptional regulator
MTDPDLSDAPSLRRVLELLPATTAEIATDLDIAGTTVEGYRNRLQDTHDIPLAYDEATHEWAVADPAAVPDEVAPDQTADLPDLDDVDVGEDPSPDALTDREEFIVRELQTGATLDALADDLDERESVVTQHLRDLKRAGWQVYIDESAGHIAIEGDHLLRSSEHKGTRTRKANRWWELRHNELVREFRDLQPPTATLDAESGHEDWVTHLTDLHAGDRVRRDDGTIVYETEEIPAVIDYITEQSLSLAEKHASTYDAAHLLWGGDMVTNEGIYEGQFEDLDAWLDEQHDTLVDPLLRQLKAFAAAFPTVQVVCMVGNHGQHRASGTSRQANADLILYKHLRNTVAQLQEHGGVLENVHMRIGDAAPYRNFALRGGDLTGHLRHGQHRRPQAETSARESEWRGTLLDHEFDIAYMGHYHISGRIPWDGPPIICSPSPKPAGEFVETLGGRTPSEYDGVATAHGVSDDGLTSVFPIDTRYYDT